LSERTVIIFVPEAASMKPFPNFVLGVWQRLLFSTKSWSQKI